jgi:hypothetical protein
MAIFKKGDRVRLLEQDRYGIPAGTVGAVVLVDEVDYTYASKGFVPGPNDPPAGTPIYAVTWEGKGRMDMFERWPWYHAEQIEAAGHPPPHEPGVADKMW